MNKFNWLIAAALMGVTITTHAKTTARDAWARATVSGQSMGGAFVTLVSTENAQLIAAKSPAAQEVQLHAMSHENGMMKMEQQPSIRLPAKQKVELKPGGLHLMFIGLKQPLAAGSKVPVTLTIKTTKGKTEIIKVMATVKALGQMDTEHTGHH
ncbi:transporter [Formosimonas limnophila]|uniref:Transporter n=1 Tax=Formosimonas limnophila TaxID=1384487 RepID=A0A8J3CLW5_9BURK|nr:copper chaperone PCu(A)C [Formosimonas limnophila]GHA63928.1 transporter [Formosimonas limnophila]